MVKKKEAMFSENCALSVQFCAQNSMIFQIRVQDKTSLLVIIQEMQEYKFEGRLELSYVLL